MKSNPIKNKQMACTCQGLQRIRHNDESILSNKHYKHPPVTVLVKEI